MTKHRIASSNDASSTWPVNKSSTLSNAHMLSIAKTLGSVYSLLSPQKSSMSAPQGMHLLDARVASFDTVKPKGKKRTSSAKGKKHTFTWDLSSPSIDQVNHDGRVMMDFR